MDISSIPPPNLVTRARPRIVKRVRAKTCAQHVIMAGMLSTKLALLVGPTVKHAHLTLSAVHVTMVFT
jgi:hypothetical protein